MTRARMERLALAHLMLSGMSIREVSAALEVSESTVRDLRRDLINLGLPPDGTDDSGLGSAAKEIQAALEPYMIEGIRADLSDWRGRLWSAPVPWDDEATEAEDDANDGDSEPAAARYRDVDPPFDPELARFYRNNNSPVIDGTIEDLFFEEAI